MTHPQVQPEIDGVIECLERLTVIVLDLSRCSGPDDIRRLRRALPHLCLAAAELGEAGERRWRERV